MLKYKIVAVINFILGTSQILISFLSSLFVSPKLQTLSTDLGIRTPSYTNILWVLAILMGVVNILVGLKLITSQSEKKEKYFTYGLVIAITTFFLFGFLVAFNTMSNISNIYSEIGK